MKPRPHITTALGVAACQAGFTVLFTGVPSLVIEVRERGRLQEMTTFKRRFWRYDLVILDELGYVSFDKASSEILFNLLSTRNLRKKNLRPKKPMGPKPDENSLPPDLEEGFSFGLILCELVFVLGDEVRVDLLLVVL